MAAETGKGRPRQQEIAVAALRATRELLNEHGYEGFGMRDVAERAGAGLGALYRRWPGKRDLVVAALRASGQEIDVPPTADPVADLLQGLVLLAHLLAQPGSDLSQAILEAKITPFSAAHQERLRRVIGSPPDFETRAAVGPALIVLQTMTTGRPPTETEIRDRILPLLLPG